WRIPLTRTVDSFGSRIDYFWKSEYSSTNQVVDLLLDRIEYGGNDTALLGPHARVLFHYASATPTCNLFPVGAREEFEHTSHRRFLGARRLDAIETQVVESGNQWRSARTVTLGYDRDADGCNQTHGPLRILTSIQESALGPPPAIVPISLPPVTFEYGPLDRDLSKFGT